jgi:hypothetical protein
MPRKFESAVDVAIRQAQERGEFDDLPGAGKPIPGAGEADDELWWVKGLLKREGLRTEAMLPRWLRLRKEVETLPERVAVLRSERAVRELVAELNAEIKRELLIPSGPKAPPREVDADAVVACWREVRAAAAPPPASEPVPAGVAGRRWWTRRRTG